MLRPRRALLHTFTLTGALTCVLAAAGCARTPTPPAETAHGRASALSRSSRDPEELCAHRVPGDVCAQCRPELVPQFKALGDWCGEHGVPESQCYACHPDLSFAPLPEPPPGADVQRLSLNGEDVPSLDAHAVKGKVTVFDFYADWCAPCREVDVHIVKRLQAGDDIAYRKLNVVSWESPLAKRYLREVPNLPFVIVYGKDGNPVAQVSGFDLLALDAAIAQGAGR